MLKNALIVVVCFTLLFAAFNGLLTTDNSTFGGGDEASEISLDFSEVFMFGYELTIGSIEVVVSIFDGSEAFFDRFYRWRDALFGSEFSLGDFLISIIRGAFSFLDQLTDELPVIGAIKNIIKTIFEPIGEFIGDIVDWLSEKFS